MAIAADTAIVSAENKKSLTLKKMKGFEKNVSSPPWFEDSYEGKVVLSKDDILKGQDSEFLGKSCLR